MYRKFMRALIIFDLYVFGSAMILTGKERIREWQEAENVLMTENRDVSLTRETLTHGTALEGQCDLEEEQNGERLSERDAEQKEGEEAGHDELRKMEVFSAEEIQVLERIVEAEAGGEDADGKLLVANVVLNRVRDEAFPNTITEVVFQRDGRVVQFSPVANGRYDAVTVSEETREAVERALCGEDISEGALFFAARKYADEKAMRWFDEKLTLLFQHGGHEFFK